MDYISEYLGLVEPEWVFWPVIGVIAWQFVQYWRAEGVQAIEHGPSTLTTIGVLGTFIGITLGLVNFDVSSIESSIPSLLEGLKTAFLTSIAGIIAGLAVKIRKFKLSREATGEEEFTPERFQSMFAEHLETQQAVATTMKEVSELLSSNRESSVSSILERLRNQLADQHKDALSQISRHHQESREDMAQFVRELAEQSTKGIIEQLESVIRDFNEKIGEQFGENFKRFESAVTLLLEWQENYKQQVEELTREFTRAVEQQTLSADALVQVRDSTASIPQHMESLDSILKANADQLEALTGNLGSFAALREKAEQSIPVIDQHIEESVKTMTDAVERASGHYQSLLSDSREMLSSFSDTSQTFSKEFKAATQDGTQQIRTSLEGVAGDVRASSEKMTSAVRESASEMKLDIEKAGKHLEDNLNRTTQQIFSEFQKTEIKLSDLMEGQWKSWDDSMQREMQRVIQQLAERLVTVSGAFVKDYQQMLDMINGTLVTAEEQVRETGSGNR